MESDRVRVRTNFSRHQFPPNADAAAVKDALIRQLYSPVRWTETIEWLAAQGVTEVIELGAGKVLSGLIKRIDKALVTSSVGDVSSLQAALSAE